MGCWERDAFCRTWQCSSGDGPGQDMVGAAPANSARRQFSLSRFKLTSIIGLPHCPIGRRKLQWLLLGCGGSSARAGRRGEKYSQIAEPRVMSTNKRKESAALFELLDKKLTLKVPKSAGSLKIPSWWSSKTNPAPVALPPPADVPEMPAPAAETCGAGVNGARWRQREPAALHLHPSPDYSILLPPMRPPAGLAKHSTTRGPIPQ